MNEVPVYMNVPERTQYDTLKEELFLRVITRNDRMGTTHDVIPTEVEGSSSHQIMTVDAKNASVLCGKLAQLANGAVYADDGTVAHIHNRKLDALEDLIESANGNPLLIAYWFQHDIARIRERFPQVRLLKTAEDMQDWNTGKIPIAAIHPASAGHGLNLQAGGNQLVWFGLTWSLELYQQTNARLWRQGQQAETVVIHHIVAADTIDEQILQALKGKDQSQESLINAVKAQLPNRVIPSPVEGSPSEQVASSNRNEIQKGA